MLITSSDSYPMMGHHPNLVFLLYIITRLGNLTYAQTPFCSNGGVYSTNSSYNNNLKHILSSLPSNIIATTSGFYNVTVGKDRDKVYALSLCRRDLASKDCYDCINSATKAAMEKCPNQKEAILWGAGSICMLRYSNRDIFGSMEVKPSFSMPNPNNISTDLDKFNKTLHGLVGSLVEKASLGSDVKFGAGSVNNSVYALVQCTPDISQDDCSVCLRGALDEVSNCCGGKEGGRFFRPSCFVWFELFKFYDDQFGGYDASLSPPLLGNSPTEPAVTSPPTSVKGNKSSTSQTVIIIIVPILGLVTLLAIGCAILLYRRSRQGLHDNDRNKSLESLQFDLRMIKEATDDFSDANKLGQGGFGSVYKGRLPNGQEIAVKRLSGHSNQGEEQFMNEILLVAKLQHRNLVSLLGFCSEASERLLIYEFLGNGSLDHFIFDPIKHIELNWELRYKIICGIARGMLYLHEDSKHRVIHRDLKASNVLLDENMSPKISDFGMARMFVMDQSEANTCRHMGTYGYMAPEYALHGRFSVKSDVFSFGVLILELVSGKKNSWWDSSEDLVHLPSYTWKNWREGTALNLIDSTLDREGSTSCEIMRCIHIGLLCVQENVEQRPAMNSVVLMLTSHSMTLPVPSRPAFFMYNSTVAGSNSKETESEQSAATDGTTYFFRT
ncbi:cysteine-rich receptor-like protein kinase 27 [Morus notabilis]|uniref:cysteine-rich receptor-like protein kinase 27 n=1 Tax=Morus notabilis TaxID=981085 RepID=UPI000CECFC5E|nr:cysteine-rich receptor-like protein kinase 27 [Morus notabilis]